MGAALAYRDRERWVKRGAYLGKNKEVFDAEAYEVMRAVRLLNEREERGRATRSSRIRRQRLLESSATGPVQPRP